MQKSNQFIKVLNQLDAKLNHAKTQLDDMRFFYEITVTSATGIVGNFTYHIVRSKPIIMIDGNGYTSGSTLYFNSDQSVSFMDDTIIDDSKDTGATVQWNGNSEFFSYKSGNGKTLTTANGTETRYNLTLNDRKGKCVAA